MTIRNYTRLGGGVHCITACFCITHGRRGHPLGKVDGGVLVAELVVGR